MDKAAIKDHLESTCQIIQLDVGLAPLVLHNHQLDFIHKTKNSSSIKHLLISARQCGSTTTLQAYLKCCSGRHLYIAGKPRHMREARRRYLQMSNVDNTTFIDTASIGSIRFESHYDNIVIDTDTMGPGDIDTVLDFIDGSRDDVTYNKMLVSVSSLYHSQHKTCVQHIAADLDVMITINNWDVIDFRDDEWKNSSLRMLGRKNWIGSHDIIRSLIGVN